MVYYISKNDGHYLGPFKKEQLIANGLDLGTLVWRQGMEAWLPANQMPELSDIIGDVPPPMNVVIDTPTATTSTPADVEAALEQQLAQSKRRKEELRQQMLQMKQQAEASTKLAQIKEEKDKETEKSSKSTTLESKSKKKPKKTKYDFPVADWRNESIWLLAFVLIHAIMALMGWTTWWYIYLDIVGAALSIAGITLGARIKKLNKISHKKNSPERLKAEQLSNINGYLVSATAAVGFLIILVQSAYYVYVV